MLELIFSLKCYLTHIIHKGFLSILQHGITSKNVMEDRTMSPNITLGRDLGRGFKFIHISVSYYLNGPKTLPYPSKPSPMISWQIFQFVK